jgi:putative ABC transport system permease protein
MNFFQLITKQMRQRALSTWLTLFSVTLGVTLAIAIMIIQREGANLFAQTDFGYDIIVGPPKGSPLQLTLNTVYHMDVSPGVIPYELYGDMIATGQPTAGRPDYRSLVRIAVPFMVGDSFTGRRIIGTSPAMFGYDDNGQLLSPEKRFQYRRDESYELAEGRVFAPRKFEAVIGSDVAESLHLKLYDPKLSDDENEKQGRAFRATHGMPGPNEAPDIHKPRWRIVGILKPTHTANDRVLFVPYISLYAIAEHEAGLIDQTLLRANIDPSRIPADRVDEVLAKLGIDPKNIPASVRKKFKLKAAASQPAGDVNELIKSATTTPKEEKEQPGEDEDAYHLDQNGDIVPDLPPEDWKLSAILVRSRGGFPAEQLKYNFRVIDDRATAVTPALVMREFFNVFLSPSTRVLLVISVLVTFVAAISIMTTIYNSVAARQKEIAVLRALGATRQRILSLICVEAAIVGLAGGIVGFLLGHALSAVGSAFLRRTIGEGIDYLSVGPEEWLYLVAVVAITFVAGLVPALKAYRTPVATNLVAS